MRRWLLLLLGVLALQAMAQGGLYKWVDEKGVVHYSDKPPAGRSGQTLKVAPQPPLEGSAAPPRSRGWQEQLQDSNERRHQEGKKQQEAQQQARAAEQKCLQARSALDTLRRERPIFRVNKEGEREYMGDEERQNQIGRWQQQADANCR